MALNSIDEAVDFSAFGCERIFRRQRHEVRCAPEELAHFPDALSRREVRNSLARCELKETLKHCARDYRWTCNVTIPDQQTEIVSEPAEIVCVAIGKHHFNYLHVSLGIVSHSVGFFDDTF
jgi:hypothetical protein